MSFRDQIKVISSDNIRDDGMKYFHYFSYGGYAWFDTSQDPTPSDHLWAIAEYALQRALDDEA